MRNTWRSLVGAAVLTLVAGACGGSSTHSPAVAHGPLDATELTWVGHLGAWQRALDATVEPSFASLDSGTMPSAKELHPVLDCRQSFRASVGAAPTTRLVSVATAMLHACGAVDSRGTDAFAERADVEALYQGMGYATAVLLRRFTVDEKLPVVGGVSTASRVEPLFSRIVTRIMLVQAFKHEPVRARCWSSRDWPVVRREEDAYDGTPPFDVAGFVDQLIPDTVNLSPAVCAALDALAYEHERPQPNDLEWFADGPRILTHETEHAIGVVDEARAECTAIQRMAATAEWLGASRSDARAMQLAAWRYYPNEPSRYVSDECRNNGTLDINVGSDVWP